MKKMVFAIPFSKPGKWAIMTLAIILITGTHCFAQKLTIRLKEETIPSALAVIKNKTGYSISSCPDYFHNAPLVSVDLVDADIRQVLDTLFAGLELEYTIRGKTINVLSHADINASLLSPVRGRVTNRNGEFLTGASVSIKGDSLTVTTNTDGLFSISCPAHTVQLEITFIGHLPRSILVSNKYFNNIVLEQSAVNLNEVIVHTYKRTTSRFTPSSLFHLKGSDIEIQPVSNGLAALEGRIPGMSLQQTSGVPGSAYKIQVRGQNSLQQSTDPLILVDGIPVAGRQNFLSTIGSGSAQGVYGANVFNSIDPSTFEHIEVLKDAAATAIYGSRGANGVILITLKKGLPGKLKCTFDVYNGINTAVKTSSFLNIQQFLSMRKEAILNDGLPVNAVTLPESTLDSSRSIDYRKWIMGNTGSSQDARIGLSWGNPNTTFLLAGNYHRETAVFPGSAGDDRYAVYGNFNYQSEDRRLLFHLIEMYGLEHNFLPVEDYTSYLSTTPNIPSFFNESGQLVWDVKGFPIVNLPALAFNTYRAAIRNQLSHLQLGYELSPGLFIRSSIGYNTVSTTERSWRPLAGQDPSVNPTGYSYSSFNNYNSEIIELMGEYIRKFGKSKLEVLLGSTWQEERTAYSSLTADGYTSDILLNTGSRTPEATSEENRLIYRYNAVFGQIDYNLLQRYILTFSGRRDGSSRFGPGRQFGNFWAIGSVWIFSDERWLKLPGWLSFGKMRGSYGKTGNDQIENNKFLEVFSPTTAARNYDGLQGVVPASFGNNNLQWEVNYKTEIGVDLGFLQNKIVLSAAAYRNWTTNQLVDKVFSSPAGLPRGLVDQRARIVNKGEEFSLQTYILTKGSFQWTATLSLTLPQNKLASFPGLASSSYSATLVEGKSLSVVKAFHYTGVDPQSGLFTFQDIDRNGVWDKNDQIASGNLDPKYYGGIGNTFQYRAFELNVFFQVSKQNGSNPFLESYKQYLPGMMGTSMLSNEPVDILNHWRRPGDRAVLQRLTSSEDSKAANIINKYYIVSDAKVIDASYIRLKTISLTYQLPKGLLLKYHVSSCRIYLRGQNLWTATHFPVTDPETQDPTVLPPMRTIATGLQLTF